jgi:hypothetical protein
VDITFVNTIMQATRTVSGNLWGTLIDSTRFTSSSLSFRNVTCRFDVAVTSGWSASDSAFIAVLEQSGTSTSPEILSSSITIENSAFVASSNSDAYFLTAATSSHQAFFASRCPT